MEVVRWRAQQNKRRQQEQQYSRYRERVGATERRMDDPDIGPRSLARGVPNAASAYLGTLNTPSNGYWDITSAYIGRFGVPAVGKRVFVSVNACVNGYEGIPLEFSARVPSA